MTLQEVSVFAPATVANFGPGFDILGLALERPGDTVVARRSGLPGVRIVEVIGNEEDDRIPLDPHLNTAGVAALGVLSAIGGAAVGVDLSIKKQMPLGSGLGSSAASAVAAAVAVNHLFGSPLAREALLPFTIEAERIACGSAHPDNVAPSLFGGIVLIRSELDGGPVVYKLPTPPQLWLVVVTPSVELRTRDARAVVPQSVPLSQVTVQLSQVAGLLHALHLGDVGLLAECLDDTLVTPYRRRLIPCVDAVMAAARLAGARGVSLSGSGPSLFAVVDNQQCGEAVLKAMCGAFAGGGVTASGVVSQVNSEGARVVGEEGERR